MAIAAVAAFRLVGRKFKTVLNDIATSCRHTPGAAPNLCGSAIGGPSVSSFAGETPRSGQDGRGALALGFRARN